MPRCKLAVAVPTVVPEGEPDPAEVRHGDYVLHAMPDGRAGIPMPIKVDTLVDDHKKIAALESIVAELRAELQALRADIGG